MTFTSLFVLAISKARVRYDLSNKQSLSFEKCIHFIFTILNILITFSSQVLFWGLGYSILTRSMLCLIDKSYFSL